MTKKKKNKKGFYTFIQNNSGGSFSGPAHYVIVEADSPDEANSIAQARADIYFDGCDKGWDCYCCGDRWYSMDDWDEADKVPSIYTEPVNLRTREMKTQSLDGSWIVLYKDGTSVHSIEPKEPKKGKKK